MTHGSLFSGIGGFDLASEWMGWENVFHCEWNSFGQQVLKYYWPNAISYGDITKTDFTVHRGQIDVLTGGFPCQPFSAAGKRKGKEDDRYLWPEMLRAIRETQLSFIVGENVAGIISMVQPGSETPVESQATFFEADNKETILEQEYVIETICSDLEREGYSVQPILIPACGVGAPHRRDRVWFVAHNTNTRTKGVQSGRKDGVHEFRIASDTECFRLRGITEKTGDNITREEWELLQDSRRDRNEIWSQTERCCKATSNPCNQRHKRSELGRTLRENRAEAHDSAAKCFEARSWDQWPTQPPICGRNDGLPSRMAGITFSKHRNESIKAYGNAIVPQVALQIFKAIHEYESNKVAV